MTAWGPDGIVTRPGEGIRIEMGQHWMEVLARSTQTDGQLGVFDFRHGPIKANPPHAHLGFAKALYVLEGYYDFRVGDVESSGGPGTVVVVSRGSQHTFTTSGGRVLFVCSPAGNEEMFLELDAAGPDVTPEQVADITKRWQTISPPGDAAAPWRPES